MVSISCFLLKDYYKVLGVTRKSTRSQIKAAFINKSKQCHPDRFPGDKAKEALFKDVNEAYQALSNQGSNNSSSYSTYPKSSYSTTSKNTNSNYSSYKRDNFGTLKDKSRIDKMRAAMEEEQRREREEYQRQQEALRKIAESIKSTWDENSEKAKSAGKTGVKWYIKTVGCLWAVAGVALVTSKLAN